MSKSCKECKHVLKKSFEEPCDKCLDTLNSKYWEPKEKETIPCQEQI